MNTIFKWSGVVALVILVILAVSGLMKAALCGSTAGAYSTQFIDNESGFPVTIATTTGGAGINFYFASSTAASNLVYPPKIYATTTQQVTGLYTSTSSLNMYILPFNKPY